MKANLYPAIVALNGSDGRAGAPAGRRLSGLAAHRAVVHERLCRTSLSGSCAERSRGFLELHAPEIDRHVADAMQLNRVIDDGDRVGCNDRRCLAQLLISAIQGCGSDSKLDQVVIEFDFYRMIGGHGDRPWLSLRFFQDLFWNFVGVLSNKAGQICVSDQAIAKHWIDDIGDCGLMQLDRDAG